jgi:hypothetical protein
LPRRTRVTADAPCRAFAGQHAEDGATSPPVPLFHDLEDPFAGHEGRTFKIMEVGGGQVAPFVILW